MATMNVSLPDKMKKWVDSRVAAADCSNASDYVRDLIRKDKERAETREWFEAEIEKGYASGFVETTIDELSKEMISAAESTVRGRKLA